MIIVDENITISGTLASENGAMANTQLNITVKGNADVVTTDSEGKYDYITAPIEGNNTITVSFDGGNAYYSSEETKSFIVIDLEKYALIDELNKTVQEQNQTINEMNNTINDLNDTINDQAGTISDMNDTINELEKELNDLKAAKNTTIVINPITDAKYNTDVTITGTLVNEDSVGLFNQVVTLTIGDKTVDVITQGGVFEYTTSFKTLEEQTVTATYAGNDKYQASEDTITFTLEKGDVIVTVDPITDVVYGDNVTITGKFTTSDGKAISNSNVKITINDKKYYAKTDKTGAYTLSAKVTSVGENNVTVGYSGNTNYNAYETTATFNVEKQDVIVTVDPIADAKLGENITIAGTFTNANGKAIKNSNVKITIDGKKYYAKTDSTGAYTFTAEMTKAGEKTVTIGYSGSDKYNEYVTETSFVVLEKA